MKFIKIGLDRYLVKDSNNLIVSAKDIKEDNEDIKENNKEKSPKTKKSKGCKDCEIKFDKKGELIDNEKSVKLDNNK